MIYTIFIINLHIKVFIPPYIIYSNIYKYKIDYYFFLYKIIINMNKWKKKYNKVILELKEYISWNNDNSDQSNLKLSSPLIWDIYYEFYQYNWNKVKLSNVFVRKGSSIIKTDFQTIYQCYLDELFYKQFIQPYIIPIHIDNDVIINLKYELVFKIDLLKEIKLHILHYLIC